MERVRLPDKCEWCGERGHPQCYAKLRAEVARLKEAELDALDELVFLRERHTRLVEAAKLRIERGHSDTCGWAIGDYPCNCGHDALGEVLAGEE